MTATPLAAGSLGLEAAIAPAAAGAHGGTLTRVVDESSLAPGESMAITAAINASERGNFTAVEGLSPGFTSVEVVNADGTDLSGVHDGSNELFAAYGDHKNIALVYEVTAANDAITTTHDSTGYGGPGFGDIRASTTGDEGISASSDTNVSAIRSVDGVMLEPDELATVHVEVNHGQVANSTLVETFIPVFDSVTIVDAGGVGFSDVHDANDELFATYGDRETVLLVHEAIAVDDGDTGMAYQFDGLVDADDSEAATGGTDELDVQSGPDDDDNWDLTRSVDDETLDPGELAVISVEITDNETTNFTVVEEFNPGFTSVETVGADGADFSGVRDVNDELFATYGDHENITPQYRATAGEDVDKDASYRLNGFTQFGADGKGVSADGVGTLAVGSDDNVGGDGGGGGGDSDDDDDDRDDDDNDESDDDDTDDGNFDTLESTDLPDDSDDDDIGDDSDGLNDNGDDSGDNNDSNDGNDDDTGDNSDDSNDGDDASDDSDGSNGDSGGISETTTDDNMPAATTTDILVPGLGVSVTLAALIIGLVLLARRRAT